VAEEGGADSRCFRDLSLVAESLKEHGTAEPDERKDGLDSKEILVPRRPETGARIFVWHLYRIPLDSIGFANGDLILLEPRDTEQGTSLEPLLRSTLSSYLRYNGNDLSSLTQMWTFEFGHSIFSGGGGGFEEDGFVACFDNGEFSWVLFSSATGPLHSPQVVGSQLFVQTEVGDWLRIDMMQPDHARACTAPKPKPKPKEDDSAE
jgi:hypothetical protein